ncbi:MAG: 16S rRNA (cytosine(967)-C(5))-methyltransferase RsmB, partial [Acetoanaerobium sp.]|nr:16S rRNA (cytosine(967)-C(5))-methyltransferase RsmB [Acetoanaerobium sp.]
KLSKQAKTVLEMGFYQLEFMDSVSDFASVDESVKLIKKVDNRSAGIINAVMRKRVKEGKSEYTDKISDKAKSLSIEFSISEYIARRFLKIYKEEFTRQLLSSMLEKPSLFIRLNKLRSTEAELFENLEQQGIYSKKNDIIDSAYEISGMKNIGSNPLFVKGGFVIQDLSSMLAVKALNPLPGDTVLDICSAPGGKSFYIADLMENKGQLDSMDISEHKIQMLKKRAVELGIDIINTRVMDATVFNEEMTNRYDKILVDAPCSGFGIIRRKPEIRYKSYEDVNQLPEIQYQILSNASKYLKDTGSLVYSTCTLEKKENIEIVDKFLENNKEFYLEEEPKELYPHIHNTDGFFIAKLKKRH